MRSLLRSATTHNYRSDDATRVGSLIDSLRKSIAILTADIEAEEQQTHVCDVDDLSYSTLAKSLRARRDNLEATIASLSDAIARVGG